MKVLFAVKSETISEAIISRYRKEYQEIITYKNVYYFNAILKEIQKNKDYDRIIISEDLESFANNNNYDTIDKFIFEKLDSISDEANDSNGNEIVILFLCSERRQKGNELLSKLFSIGIYNALLGDDRSVTGVCKLIREPRTKKEAKNYYKIDSDASNYRPESENEVSEVEIQNILTHFRKLGKETEKYVASFDNIAAQYSEEQLKIIANCLPIKVKNILAASSEKYKRLAANTFGLGGVNTSRYEDKSESSGIKIDTLSGAASKNKINKPIVIPSGVKKITSKKISNFDEKSSNTSGIKVQRKPSSLQEQIERRNIEEIERKEALRKQKVLEENEQGNVKQKVESVKKDNLDEVPDKKIKKSSGLENKLEEEDIFLSEEVDVNNNSKVVSKELEDEDLFVQDFDEFNDFDDIEIEEPKENTVAEKIEIEDDDIFAEDFDEFDDFDDIEIEEPKESKVIEKTESNEDDIFADDFDDFDDLDDIEIEEPKESKVIEKTESNEDDIFADDFDDFDDFDDIEIEEPKESKVIEKTELNADDIFSDDFDDFDFDDTEIEKTIESEVIEKTESSEDDMFAEDFDEFGNFEDIEDIELQELNESVSPVNDKTDFDVDDLFGDDALLPGIDDVDGDIFEENIEKSEPIIEEDEDIFGEATIPGLDDLDDDIFEENMEKSKPIIEDEDIFSDEAIVPGLDDLDEEIMDSKNIDLEDDEDIFGSDLDNTVNLEKTVDKPVESIKSEVNYSVSNLNKLLTKEKKIVNFIGTTKNGTSFLVNNLAKLFSSIGINTAILDLTINKNSYYIFTNSDERLRKIASVSFDKLEKGYAEGIKVDKNLTVYTAIPNSNNKTYNAENIFSTLVQNHSLILVDCDYATDYAYFALCQEIYLVQSMDILTMQPLTTFLRELQVRDILDSEKLRVVINKEIKVRDLNPKMIIGGMSCYKDPGMSVMVKLFNKDMVQACSIPFEENTYSKYLEAMVNCELSLSGYSKNFMAKLKNLGDMIYPLNSKPSYSNGPINQNYKPTTFSNDMNKTLNQMKKKY